MGFWGFLQLGEKLRIKDVNLGLKLLRNHVMLQESQVEKDQDVIKVDTRSKELEVLLADLHGPIQVAVHELAYHIVFFDLS